MEKREKVWLVSEVFYPDTDIATGNIATEIALKLAEHYEVNVICGPKDYERKTNNETKVNLSEHIILHRWSYFNFDKNHSIKRLLRVVGISLGLFIKGFNIKKREKVLVISNPAFITPLYALLRKIKKFKYYLLMHDVFPENLIAGGYTNENSLIYKMTKRVFVNSRKSINKTIVIGRDMKELLIAEEPDIKKDRVVIIPNWTDINSLHPTPFEDNIIIKKYALTDKIVILFAGNHGVLQNLKKFLQIIKTVENPILHFILAGGGATKNELIQYATDNNITNITFLPAFPRSELNNVLNASHIGLVSLTDDLYGVGVPSKSYNILAVEKPILFLGNIKTEIPMFIQENNIGWAFSYKQEEDIIRFLEGINKESLIEIKNKGKIARRIASDKFDKEKILEQILSFIKSA